MKTIAIILFGALLFAGSLKVFALPQTQPAQQKTAKPVVNKTAKADPGEQKFKENCGRCHMPPDSISPREVKAVVKHMRVRAMLTEEDERLILKYLNP